MLLHAQNRTIHHCVLILSKNAKYNINGKFRSINSTVNYLNLIKGKY